VGGGTFLIRNRMANDERGQLFIRVHNETLPPRPRMLNFSGFFMLDRSRALRLNGPWGYLG
jgi:hypothetical protein